MSAPRSAAHDAPASVRALIVIGCSAGGLGVCEQLLASFQPGEPLALIIVQHRAPARSPLAEVLQSASRLRVSEPDDKAPICPGEVLVAPPGYHLLVEPGHIALSTEEPRHFSRPSIDVTFASAADAYAEKVIGVVLTGANADGTDGAREIVRRGGRLLVQDPSTAYASAMPSAILDAGLPAEVVAPEHLGATVRARALSPHHNRPHP